MTRNLLSSVRLRFAPSPTGHLHLGGLRTALFNHLLARKLNGKWILRIEDTDQSRLVPGAIQSIIKTLQWAKLDYDEGPDLSGQFGPYVQSQRRAIYEAHRDRLLQVGISCHHSPSRPLSQTKQAYRCFCSPKRLDQMRQEFRRSGSNLTYDRKCLQMSDAEQARRLSEGTSHVVRLRNSDTSVSLNDLVYGQLTFLNNTQDDVILIKADGTPTYHFANVVDDHHMRISHVLRGEEWLSSTPKHILLYQALGFPVPQFAHLPLLVNADGSKLSKRSGDVRVEEYIVGQQIIIPITKGYEPEALLNFVALMGMNHSRHQAMDKGKNETTTSDMMTMEQMISMVRNSLVMLLFASSTMANRFIFFFSMKFSLDMISKHRATMSQPKLVHLNQQHIGRGLLSKEPERVRPWINRARSLLVPNSAADPEDGQESMEYIHRVLLAMKVHTTRASFFRLSSAAALPPPPPSATSSTLRNIFSRCLTLKKKDKIKIRADEILATTEAVLGKLEEKEEWTQEEIGKRLWEVSGRREGGSGQVMRTLRHAITGRNVNRPRYGPDYPPLGKAKISRPHPRR
ncbi:glutamate--tRNA ligase [Puccinia sorghi]|uniref:glutamate--tRNA ligase n=1 Tax=Puccinia sorghi TaxID=27349 RepID=A0A0L6VBG2_9BASI|nr:glutamate--tRNA ligase [Puccinia sorghi]